MSPVTTWREVYNAQPGNFRKKPVRRVIHHRRLTCEPLEERQLLTTWGPLFEFDTWNQNPTPYWDDTPTDPVSGRQTYVGCVATAAAQILQYWKYPDTIDFSAADRYLTRTHGISIDGDAGTNGFPTLAQLDAALSQIDYDLSNQEIAEIGFGVGVKYEMNYANVDVGGRRRGSGAWTNLGERIFQDDFGFGSARWDTWSSSVETDVIENLKAGWPVILSIGVAGQSSGHAVVLEGYRDDNPKDFYVNLGWGGTDDGWYDLPNITTPSLNPDFDVITGAVYNISPAQGWGQILGDAENTSFSPYAIPDVSTEKWHQTTDGNHSFKGILSGTGGNVYVANTANHPGLTSSLWVVTDTGVKMDEILLPAEIGENNHLGYPAQASNGSIFIPEDDGAIYSVNPQTRAVTTIFQEPNDDQIRSITIDEDGMLYVATFSSLYCLDQVGTQQWAYQVPSNGMILRDEVPVDDVRDRVYLPYYITGSNTSHLAMIDRSSGNLLHTENFGAVSSASYSAGTPSIGSDGTVYVGNYTTLYAFNPDSTLSEKWHEDKYPSLMHEAPTIGGDGTLYVRYWKPNLTDQVVAALYADTGDVKWEIPFQLGESDNIVSVLAGSNDMIAFSISEENGTNADTYSVYVYQDTGNSYQEMWQREFGSSGGTIALGPGNTLYVLPSSGYGHTITAIGSGLGRGAENNSAPNTPDNTGVPDFSTVADTSVVLSWDTSDPDTGDEAYMKYTVWGREGGTDVEYILASDITETSYTWSGLKPGTQYSWYVIASDGQAVTYSEAWTFFAEGEPPRCTLDVDDSGHADALTDGLLILRYLFGFTGNELVADVLAPDARRTDADDIVNFLDDCRSTVLDPDDGGQADALTDGLLILRYLFGFTGNELVADVLAPDAQRIDPDDIASFLGQFLPSQTLLNAPEGESPLMDSKAREIPALPSVDYKRSLTEQPEAREIMFQTRGDSAWSDTHNDGNPLRSLQGPLRNANARSAYRVTSHESESRRAMWQNTDEDESLLAVDLILQLERDWDAM